MSRVRLWLPVLLWAGLIWHLSSIPGLRITEAWWDIVARKLAHMVVFGVLALLIRRALAGSTGLAEPQLSRQALVWTVLYAIVDEVHQHFVPQRHGAVTDVIIDGLGAWLACRLMCRFLPVRESPREIREPL